MQNSKLNNDICKYYKSLTSQAGRCEFYKTVGKCGRTGKNCKIWNEKQKQNESSNESSVPFKLEVQESPKKPKRQILNSPILVRNISKEEIESFKQLNSEVCISSYELGDIWVVPHYDTNTPSTRNEISINHAVLLTALCSAFPGAKITQFKKR